MQLGREMKRRLKATVAPLIFLSLVGYFSWSAAQGNHGLVAYAQRETLLAQAQTNLAKAQAERDAWERRVPACGHATSTPTSWMNGRGRC